MYRDDFTQWTNGFGVQGDVPIIRRDKLPENAKPIPGNVLRSGKSTGHHHIIDAPPDHYQLYDVDGVLWMELFQPCPLKHQTHGTLIFQPGVYVVPDQVEYDGEDERKVED